MQRILLGLLALAVIPADCQTLRPAVRNAVQDAWRPIAFDQQKLTGVLANRIRANVEGNLEQVNENALLASGGALGQFLQAAADAYAYTHDFQLRQVMDRVAEDYLSSNENRPAAATSAGQVEAASDQVLGLLNYYIVTGDQSAFTAAQKLSAALPGTPAKEFDQPCPLQALLALYRYGGDERDLNFCKNLAGSWHLDSQTLQSRIDSDHARSILSNLSGLVELYRLTGDESYLRPVVRFWKEIRDQHLSITGTLQMATDREPASNCTTVAWMQLTLELLRLTGQPQYAGELERTIYNQLFAAQNAANGEIAPAVALHGQKNFSHHVEPCISAESRGLSLLPQLIWGRYGKGIAVMQYSGGRASFRVRRRGTIQIYSEAAYPETGTILLHIDPGHPLQFPLSLRVPEWTARFTADIGDWHLIGKPGQFVTIDRQWQRGDTVRIAIDMSVRQNGNSSTHEVAIQRGPQVLALSSALNPALSDLSRAVIPALNSSVLKLNPAETRLPANWPGDQAYSLPGTQLILVPFADATGSYTVWLKPAQIVGQP